MKSEATKALVAAARHDLTVLEGGFKIGWYGLRGLIEALERDLERETEAADGFAKDERFIALAGTTVDLMHNMERDRQVEQVAAALAAAAGFGYRGGFDDGVESAEAEAADLEEGHSPQ